MSDVGDLLLTALLNHGNLLLGGALFMAAFGVPLPATMLLMAAGAFARQGVLGMEGAAGAAVAGAVVGDGCSYVVGRYGAALLPERLQAAAGAARAAQLFARWGGWSVFITRFLLTPIALPVNLLAGSTGYPLGRFFAAVLAGELIWVALFGGLGYLFADRWEELSRLATDLVGTLLGAALALAGLVAYVLRRRRTCCAPSP